MTRNEQKLFLCKTSANKHDWTTQWLTADEIAEHRAFGLYVVDHTNDLISLSALWEELIARKKSNIENGIAHQCNHGIDQVLLTMNAMPTIRKEETENV